MTDVHDDQATNSDLHGILDYEPDRAGLELHVTSDDDLIAALPADRRGAFWGGGAYSDGGVVPDRDAVRGWGERVGRAWAENVARGLIARRAELEEAIAIIAEQLRIAARRRHLLGIVRRSLTLRQRIRLYARRRFA